MAVPIGETPFGNNIPAKIAFDALLPGSQTLGSLVGKKKKGASSSDKALAAFSRELLAASRDARRLYYGQLGEALTTGRPPAARVPQAQFAQEGALAQAGGSRQAVLEGMAARTIDPRSTAAQSAIGATEQAAQSQAALAPSDLANQYLAQAPNAVIGAAQTSLGGFSALSQIATQRAIAQAAREGAAYQSIGSGIGGLAGLGIGAYTGTGYFAPGQPGGRPLPPQRL